MPNIKSAKKRLRTAEAARQRNMRERSRVTTARRQFNDAVNAGNREAGETALKTYSSVLDKAVKHSIMNRNTAIRRKRRAANRMRALAS